MNSEKEHFSCIAVDMGAGSIRVMLGRLSKEVLSLKEIHRFSNEIQVREGIDTWDMDRIAREIQTGISMAIEASDQVPGSIGVDSWGVDYVLLDAHGELVETPVAYRDKRTEGMQDTWRTRMSDSETFSRTGINSYVFNTLYQLLSAEDSHALRRSSHLLFVPCYINFLLSGVAVNELTIASTSQILQVDGGDWDPDILEKLDLEAGKLGNVVSPGTRLGPVRLEEFSEIAMENVAVCGHDTACVVAALPVQDPNFAFISAGTWCIVGLEADRPLISEEARLLGITNERSYGNSYRPLKNIVGLWLLQGLKKEFSDDISFAQMEAMIRDERDISQVIDPDDPQFYNPGSMKKAFMTYFEKTGQPIPPAISDYIRCAYDSLCFSFRYYVEELEKLSGKSLEVLHLVGGGSQSDYLCQRVATLCKRKVISGPVEGASMGNILIQGLAMGVISSLQEGRELVKRSCRVKEYEAGSLTANLEERYKKYLSIKS
jgi:rhamnulokinase